jgi:hypothetical protein
MASINDFPELKIIFDGLMKEREELLGSVGKLREEYDGLRQKQEEYRIKSSAVGEKIKKATQPRLSVIDQQLSAIARSIGGKRTSDS